jgi:hypothetical protein
MSLWSRSIGLLILTACLADPAARGADNPRGTSRVSFFGYDDCVALQNDETRVVLCHQSGGRVLEYALNGVNAIALDEAGRGWLPGNPDRRGASTGGRIDIGPEQTIPRHPVLWEGSWTAETPAPFTARLTSQKDESTGVQLVREFVLDDDSSELKVTQTIRNVADGIVEYCHWSRTFGQGGGVVVLPVTEPSRFPNKYVMYEPDNSIQMRPVDPHITLRDGCLIIHGSPQHPKLGFDTAAGWFAYAMPNDLLWVKRYPVYRDRVYNEVAGLTVSIWYPDRPMVELEPIGPRERLKPGEEAAFTETWTLHPFEFPAKAPESIDVQQVRRMGAPTE